MWAVVQMDTYEYSDETYTVGVWVFDSYEQAEAFRVEKDAKGDWNCDVVEVSKV